MRTSISLTPTLRALPPADSPARVAAKGVLLRVPLKPMVPEESHARVSPLVSVMVTMVLFWLARMCAMPRTTFFRTFLTFLAMRVSFY